MRRPPGAALLLVALAACGVKAPPRPSGAPDKEPPHRLFRAPADPNTPALELDRPGEEPPR